MSEGSVAEVSTDVDPVSDRWTKQQTAKFLGCTTRQVMRYEDDGKIIRLTKKGASPQLYDAQSVRAFALSRRNFTAQAVDAAIEQLPVVERTRVELASALSEMLAAATDHTEESMRLALGTAHKFVDLMARDTERVRDHWAKNEARLIARCEKLEGELDQFRAAVETMRELDEERARRRQEEEKRAKQSAVMIDAARLVIPGLVSRLTGGTPEVSKVGVERIFATLTPEQKVQLSGVLTIDQLSALALLFPETPASKEKELNGNPG
jgi:hypothetical protein